MSCCDVLLHVYDRLHFLALGLVKEHMEVHIGRNGRSACDDDSGLFFWFCLVFFGGLGKAGAWCVIGCGCLLSFARPNAPSALSGFDPSVFPGE